MKRVERQNRKKDKEEKIIIQLCMHMQKEAHDKILEFYNTYTYTYIYR